MKLFVLNNMIKGWFVGNFEPTALKTKEFEVAVKEYKAGDSEAPHFHKIAIELTLVVSGEIMMNGIKLGPGSIVALDPMEEARFSACTDAVTVVVKTPSLSDDKFLT